MLKDGLVRLIEEGVPDGAQVRAVDRHGLGDNADIEVQGGFYSAPGLPLCFLLASATPGGKR
jgi:hypothetical protein